MAYWRVLTGAAHVREWGWQHWAEKLPSGATATEASANPIGSSGTRTALQRCPMFRKGTSL